MKILIIILQVMVQFYCSDYKAMPEGWACRAIDNTIWYYFKDGENRWWVSDDDQKYILFDSAQAKYYNQYVERKKR